MSAFFTSTDASAVAWQKAALLGLNLDLRRPPVLAKKDAAGFTRCRKLFRGFRAAEVLVGSKHVPAPDAFPRIERQVEVWLQSVAS